jgi:uncharacterized protein (DUF362 family)
MPGRMIQQEGDRMASRPVLKKGGLTRGFRKALEGYYQNVEGGAAFIAARWQRWKGRRNVAIWCVEKAGDTMGYIAYDRERSTIEEILALSCRQWNEPLVQMLDALIRQESLVSAEILREDEAKYRTLVDYGFRPVDAVENEGLNLVRFELSTVVLLERTRDCKPFRRYRKTETVAIERVDAASGDSEIGRGLTDLLRNLGGLSRFVKKGQSVLIKPNIVSDHGLKNNVPVGGIVTDIRVVRELVKLLLPVAGRITVAEGSSINRSETAKMFTLYGYDSVVALDPSKVRLVDLNADELVEKPVLGGKRIATRKVPLSIERADVIINLPVLKIHFAAMASLSIKNLQGAMPPIEKYMTHFFGLWQTLVNIHHVIKPDLIIIDGLIGLEDFGPVSGTPKPMNVLVGGTNPVAVDATAMRIMGLQPLSSPPVRIAYMQGLGPVEEKRIKIAGTSVAEVASPFKQPEIDVNGGRDISIYADSACPGCRGYLHFALSKLRRPDPQNPQHLLIDRPFEKPVRIFLGPETPADPVRGGTNVFMGLCQQHNSAKGSHLQGCPPHAEVILNMVFGLFPDVEQPKYAEKTEETKLGEMLQQVLAMRGRQG